MHQDFPIEPEDNSNVITPSPLPLKIRYGGDRWGSQEWLGRVYPMGTKEKDFLSHYINHFNAIHIKATHYKNFLPEQVAVWKSKAEGKDFMFCPQVHQSITHYSTFKDIDEKTDAFLNSIYAFGNQLGPVLLQVSARFSPMRKDPLFKYLQTLPTDVRFFLEVGNPQWFEEEEYKGLLRFLRQNNIGLVISDGDLEKRPLLLDLTVPACFIRYYATGDRLRVDKWYQKIKDWGTKGLLDAYFFVEANGDVEKQLDDLLYFKNLVDNG